MKETFYFNIMKASTAAIVAVLGTVFALALSVQAEEGFRSSRFGGKIFRNPKKDAAWRIWMFPTEFSWETKKSTHNQNTSGGWQNIRASPCSGSSTTRKHRKGVVFATRPESFTRGSFVAPLLVACFRTSAVFPKQEHLSIKAVA